MASTAHRERVAAELKRIREGLGVRVRQAEERLAAGEAWQDHGLVFPSEVGSRSIRTTSPTGFRRCASGPGSDIGTRTNFAILVRRSCLPRAPRCMWCRKSSGIRRSRSPRMSTGT